jgi:hypothetical protein
MENQPYKAKIAVLDWNKSFPSVSSQSAQLCEALASDGFTVHRHSLVYRPGNAPAVDPPAGPQQFTTSMQFIDGLTTRDDLQSGIARWLDEIAPACVFIDCGHLTPLVARAARRFPYIILEHGMVAVCPLNGLRVVPNRDGTATRCPVDQLQSPEKCSRCMAVRTGGFEESELAALRLSQFGSAVHLDELKQSLWDAREVLAPDPAAQRLLAPHCRSVRIVPIGADRSTATLESETTTVIVPPTSAAVMNLAVSISMAAGRCIVAPRIGSMDYLLEDRISGLLFDPENPQALPRRVRELADNPQLRQTLGSNARAEARKKLAWPVLMERSYRPLMVIA